MRKRVLSEVLNEIDKGTYSRPSSLSFEQFAKEWLLSRRQLRGSTEAGYSSLIDKQLIPRLGFNEGFPCQVRGYRRGCQRDDRGVELASKTIHNAVMLLRNMLAGRKGPSAFRRGSGFCGFYVGRKKLPPLAYRQIVPPTPSETWTLIKAAKLKLAASATRSRTWALSAECDEVRFWVLGSSTFDGSIMRSASNTPSRNGTASDGIRKCGVVPRPAKISQVAARYFPATDSVMRLLADLKVGNADSGFIFPGHCHGFIDPDRFETDIWRPIVKRAELTGTRFHDLRHFFASQLIAITARRPAYVRDQMGHSSTSTLPSIRTGTCFPRPRERKPARGTKNRWTQPAGNRKRLLAMG